MTTTKRSLMILGIVIGLACIAAGIEYVTHKAGALPHFFPGYEAGSITLHMKHAIAAFLIGLAALIFAWFQGGPKKVQPTNQGGTPPSAPLQQ